MAGHGSAGSYLEPQQMCDYVLLRHANVSKDAENEKLYKVRSRPSFWHACLLADKVLEY